MSKIETNTIDNISGSSTLNLGDTNATAITIDSGVSTLTIPNGITTGHMYPMFQAKITANKTATTGEVEAKVPFDTEDFDTDSAYDKDTNYRFTVPTGKGGKYFISAVLRFETGGVSRLDYFWNIIKKNGTSIITNHTNFQNNQIRSFGDTVSGIIELNAGDYVESWYAMSVTTGTSYIGEGTKGNNSRFFGYRLGA